LSDKAQSNRIICEGGLDTTNNYLNLSANKPGCATRLINYEVGLSGGYRRINGFQPYDPAFAEVGAGTATGRVLGIIIFDNSDTGITQIIAARKNSADDNYQLYDYQSGTGWVAITTGLTHKYIDGGSEVDKLRYSVGNDGAKNYLAIVDGVNNAVIFDGTTWAFVKSTNDGLALATAGGNQAIDAPFLVTFFKNTLFLASDLRNDKTGLLSYSAPNKFYDFLAADGGGQMPCGAAIVDFKPFRDKLFIFGENQIKSATADVTAGFLQEDVTGNIGCVARDSVIEIGGDLIFLAPDGFRPISGTDKIGDVELESISKPIHQLVSTRVAAVAGTAINSLVIRGKSQFRYFFGDDSFPVSDSKGIIGALRTSDQQTGWEFGELLGIRVSCATSRYIGGSEVVIHGDFDGCVYRQESGNSMNGANVVSSYSTPYLDLGDTETRKIIEKVNTYLNGEGSIGISLKVDYDWGRSDILSPSAYPIEVAALIPLYDSGVEYDTGVVYGGVLTPIFISNIEGSFFSARFTFSGASVDPPHSIHALVVEYILQGRR